MKESTRRSLAWLAVAFGGLLLGSSVVQILRGASPKTLVSSFLIAAVIGACGVSAVRATGNKRSRSEGSITLHRAFLGFLGITAVGVAIVASGLSGAASPVIAVLFLGAVCLISGVAGLVAVGLARRSDWYNNSRRA